MSFSFFTAHSSRFRDCIPKVSKIDGIKRFLILYPSSKNISIAGAIQKNFSSSKEIKTHFLSTHSTCVRDRTACLNSFWFVAYMQTKRVSSDSPTLIDKTNVSRERYVCFVN